MMFTTGSTGAADGAMVDGDLDLAKLGVAVGTAVGCNVDGMVEGFVVVRKEG